MWLEMKEGRSRAWKPFPFVALNLQKMVEALGFRGAAGSIKDRVAEDYIMEGDAQGMIKLLQGTTQIKSQSGCHSLSLAS